MDRRSCANRAAVRLNTLQFDFDPVILAAYVVSQQGRWLVQIHDHDIQIAVVVEVTESTAAAAVQGVYRRTCLPRQLFKAAIPQAAKHDARPLVRLIWSVLQLRVDSARHPEDVRVSI